MISPSTPARPRPFCGPRWDASLPDRHPGPLTSRRGSRAKAGVRRGDRAGAGVVVKSSKRSPGVPWTPTERRTHDYHWQALAAIRASG
jgi:hypothetical protein